MFPLLSSSLENRTISSCIASFQALFQGFWPWVGLQDSALDPALQHARDHWAPLGIQLLPNVTVTIPEYCTDKKKPQAQRMRNVNATQAHV